MAVPPCPRTNPLCDGASPRLRLLTSCERRSVRPENEIRRRDTPMTRTLTEGWVIIRASKFEGCGPFFPSLTRTSTDNPLPGERGTKKKKPNQKFVAALSIFNCYFEVNKIQSVKLNFQRVPVHSVLPEGKFRGCFTDVGGYTILVW